MHTSLSTEDLDFVNQAGELAALIRNFDWKKTALGPIAGWPAYIKIVTSVDPPDLRIEERRE